MEKLIMHEMRLNQEPFADISVGTKTVEIRLNDAKRRAVQIGDTIRFTLRSDTRQTVLVKVIDKKHYKTYADLVADTPVAAFGPQWTSRKQILKAGWPYHTDEEQKQFGFVIFYIQLLDAVDAP